jgi:hypothetical protein
VPATPTIVVASSCPTASAPSAAVTPIEAPTRIASSRIPIVTERSAPRRSYRPRRRSALAETFSGEARNGIAAAAAIGAARPSVPKIVSANGASARITRDASAPPASFSSSARRKRRWSLPHSLPAT